MTSRSRALLALGCPPNTRIHSPERQKYFNCGRDDSIEKPPTSIFVRVAFLALGVSSLLPWNAIVTTLPFFLSRLHGTPLHDVFTSWLSLLSNGMGLLAIGFVTWAGDQFTRPSSFFVSMIFMACLFSFLATCPFIPISPNGFFAIGLTTSTLLAAAGGFLQASTITLAHKYGPGAIAYYMSGSALSAVGISILQVATAYTSTGILLPDLDSASWSATICFMTSVMILVLTLGLYQALNSSPQTTLDRFEICKDFDVEGPLSEHTRLLPQSSQPLPITLELQSNHLTPRSTVYNCNFSIFYAGVVTLCLFPAVTASIEPADTAIDPLTFNALHLLIFNTADLAGRSLASIPGLFPTNGTFLAIYSILRSIFIPFFILCNVSSSSTPTVITSDAVYMLGLFLFGLTHGHCSTLSLVVTSEGEDKTQDGRAARLAQLWMMVGIVVGGGASFGVYAIL